MTPMADGLRLAGTVEFAGLETAEHATGLAVAPVEQGVVPARLERRRGRRRGWASAIVAGLVAGDRQGVRWAGAVGVWASATGVIDQAAVTAEWVGRLAERAAGPEMGAYRLDRF